MLEQDRVELRAKQVNGTISEDELRRLASFEPISRELAQIENRTDPVTSESLPAQLYIYDPAAYDGDGRAAIGIGNLDTADQVAFMVPGLGTTVAGMTGNRPVNVYNESRWPRRAASPRS